MTKCKCKARRCCKMCFSCLNQLRNLTVEGCQYRSVHQDLLRDLLMLSTSTYSQVRQDTATHTPTLPPHPCPHTHTQKTPPPPPHTHTQTHTHMHVQTSSQPELCHIH